MAYTPLGELDGTATDPNEGFLRLWAGETLATFQEANKFLPLIQTRTISQGKSATFPVIGTAAARWHQPGESLITDTDSASQAYNSQIKVEEKEIFIDDMLTSSVLVDSLDEMKVHWDVRSEYTSAIGRALAKEVDEHILASVLAGAKASANISGVTAAGYDYAAGTSVATSSADFIAAAQDIAQRFDENDVPPGDRYLAVQPSIYYLLQESTSKLIDRDYVADTDALSSGMIMRLSGMQIVKTNNFGSGDQSAVADGGAKNDVFGASGIGYNGNWTNVVALAFHRSAVGCVKMADLSVQSEYLLERLATLMVAKMAIGHNYLRPEACAVMRAAAS